MRPFVADPEYVIHLIKTICGHKNYPQVEEVDSNYNMIEKLLVAPLFHLTMHACKAMINRSAVFITVINHLLENVFPGYKTKELTKSFNKSKKGARNSTATASSSLVDNDDFDSKSYYKKTRKWQINVLMMMNPNLTCRSRDSS